MSKSRPIVWMSALAVAAAVAALARPDWADRVSPRLGDGARALRAALPKGLGVGEAPPRAGAPIAGGGPAARPPVSVLLAQAKVKPTPLRIEAIGTVQPAAQVAIRPRVDSQIAEVPVADGAAVKKGDVLIRLDSRQIEAQIRQAEAQFAKDVAGRDQAERDAKRIAELVQRGSGAQTAADTARTAAESARAVVAADEAALENLRVQQSYYTIRAPISGRIGVVALKAGAAARQGESAGVILTVNQMSPIYVSFTVPQARLTNLREAMARGEALAYATPQGGAKTVEGKVSFLDNAIDAATGSIVARALFENADETLWPGQFCNVRVVLGVDKDAVVVPKEAVMTGQNGPYVYALDGETAKLRPVKVSRTVDEDTVIASGVSAGDQVVVEGQSMLTPGARVAVRKAADAGGGAVTGAGKGPGKGAGKSADKAPVAPAGKPAEKSAGAEG